MRIGMIQEQVTHLGGRFSEAMALTGYLQDSLMRQISGCIKRGAFSTRMHYGPTSRILLPRGQPCLYHRA